MYTIIIGEEEEYGKRLVKYLETFMDESVRIYSFTHPEALLQCEERGDCYLLREDFYKKLEEWEGLEEGNRKRSIIISAEEKQGCFCRYHAPEELVSMIRDMIRNQMERKEEGDFQRRSQVTAIFSPIFDEELMRIAMKYMKPGDLYLGMEDIGAASNIEGNMGDLCYYIHLKEEQVVEYMEELVREEEERYYLNSPDLYFDLLELTKEEYTWFFQLLKKEKKYAHIYVGLGSGVISHMNLSGIFDRFFVVDSKENIRLHAFCNRLEKVVQAGHPLFQGTFERIYREDTLYEEVQ